MRTALLVLAMAVVASLSYGQTEHGGIIPIARPLPSGKCISDIDDGHGNARVVNCAPKAPIVAPHKVQKTEVHEETACPDGYVLRWLSDNSPTLHFFTMNSFEVCVTPELIKSLERAK